MTITRLGKSFVDERGIITDIIKGSTMEYLSVIFSKRGSIRGNHFHKLGGHYVFILDGAFRLVAKKGEATTRRTLKPGDLVWLPKNVPHAFVAMEDTRALEISPRFHNFKDTYRLEHPLT